MKILIPLLVAGIAAAQCPAPYYQRAIAVNSGQVTGTQTNFPMLVLNPTPSLRTIANGGRVTNANGYDIIFVNSDGSALPFELVGHGTGSTTYSPTTGNAEFWVNVASLATGSTVYMCYGNSAVSTYQGGTGAWNTGYKGLWHQQTTADSTASGFTLTPVNTPTTTAGQIAGAYNFVAGSTQYQTNANAPVTTYPLTLSAWVKFDSVALGIGEIQVVMAISKPDTIEDFWFDIVNLAGTVGFRTVAVGSAGAASRVNLYDTVPDTNWHRLTAVFTNSTTQALYYDGVSQSIAMGYPQGMATTPAGLSDFFIGGTILNTVTNYGNVSGKIDQVSVQNVAISAGWAEAEFNNQSAPDSFYSVGYEIKYFQTAISGDVPLFKPPQTLNIQWTGAVPYNPGSGIGGDTEYFTWTSPATQPGNFGGGAIIGAYNDGGGFGCNNSSICVFQIVDFNSSIPSATISLVNNMSGYGAAAAPQCYDGVRTMKSRKPFAFDGVLFLPVFCMTDGPPFFGYQSGFIVSPDGGGNWCNLKTFNAHATAPNCDSANWNPDGDNPTDAAGFQWPFGGNDGNKMSRMMIADFLCQDNTIACPAAAGMDPAYLYFFTVDNAGAFYVARVAKSLGWKGIMLGDSNWQVYNSGVWTSTVQNASDVSNGLFAAGGICCSSWTYLKDYAVWVLLQHTDSQYYTAPYPWGPWSAYGTLSFPAGTSFEFPSLVAGICPTYGTPGRVTCTGAYNGPTNATLRLIQFDLGPVHPVRATTGQQ